MRASTRVVAGFLFCSGLSALVYQTAWQRSLRLVFGASTAASAAVLAVFLGGLGVGGVVLGRRAERSLRPLSLYGNLEVGVSLMAAVSPFMLAALGRVYLALGGSEVLGGAGATALRLLVTVVALGPAVFLMGGTLPAAARAVEGEADAGRSRLAVLYGANTLGAVAGSVLGTFVLFELFGTRLSLWIAALVNLLVAVLARSLGRDADEVPVSASETEPARDGSRVSASAAVAYGVAFAVGFAFLLLEIVWYRLLAPVLGGSTYTFGLVLATALAGIGLGGFAYSLRGEHRRATLGELALVTSLEGVFVALPIALGDDIALFAAFTRPMATVGFGALVGSWASITALVVFPASLISGYQFPLLFALIGEGRDRVARHVGVAYAFNTAGSILGSLLGGLYLIPRIGAVGCFRLVAVVLLTVGVAVAVRSAFGGRSVLPKAVAAIAMAGLGALFTVQRGPTAIWRHQPIGAGRAHPPTASKNALRAWKTREAERIVWEADGVETAVALNRSDQLAFVVDGKSDGAVFIDRSTQAGLGLFGALIHGAPKDAFVVGLGTGMTAGWLASVHGVRRVDVAELEPAIVEVARAAAPANHDVLALPNVFLHFGDARELLLASRREYDLVVSEPSNPYRAGISALYTQEYYEAALSRLRPGGLFVQWVQGYEVDAHTVRAIVRTLRSAFRNVEAWQTQYGDILFVGGREPPVLDAERLRALVELEPYRSGLTRTQGVSDAEGFLGRFLAGDATLAAISEIPGVPVNTDDENMLDYAFARAAGQTDETVPAALLARATKDGADRPSVRGAVDWDRVFELRPRAWIINDTDPPSIPQKDDQAARRVAAVALGCAGRSTKASSNWRAQSAEPKDDLERFVAAIAYADAGHDRGAVYADVLESRGLVVEASFARARRAARDKDELRAFDFLGRAIEALRKDALPLCKSAQQVLRHFAGIASKSPALAARGAEALLVPFAAGLLDDERRDNAEKLAAAADPALCVRALGTHLERPRWEEAHLKLRLRCVAAANHPLTERAAADLLEYLGATAGAFD